MPRPPRVDFPGARHHVMNRGARHEAFFTTSEVCADFMGVLSELPGRFGLRVHGYALMPNHFHLLLESTRGELSEGMAHLQGHFSRLLNERYGWDGPLFRSRFKSRLVDDDAWWMHLLAYLHLNPVKAHLAPSAADAHFTSHAAYIGQVATPEWLTTDELLASFVTRADLEQYVQHVQVGRERGPDGFDADDLWGLSKTTPTRPAPQPYTGYLEPELALQMVAELTGVPASALPNHRRGKPGNRAAWLAAWWLDRATALSQAEIGAALGTTQTGVSQRLRLLRRREADDPELRRWMEALEEARAIAKINA